LPLISSAQPALLACGTYYVVEQDTAIVGAGGWTPDRKDCTLGHVRHVVTDDRTLRRGVARALMHHCFDVARAAGTLRMECWSTRTAEPFYRALGFESLGPMEVTLQAGITFPSIRMIRDL
jgi:N-acetylglutamate synthase-like GNAT family acetyltransferase